MNLHRVVVRGFLLFFFFILQFSGTKAGAQVRPQVVQVVDNARRVTLVGNVHPLALVANDRGTVAESMPMSRMLLLLKRSDEQESALQAYMEQQQSKSSPNYHGWLSPQEFGAQYGPADADIQAVTDWLAQQGFTIGKVYAGKTIIEFSGTASQVQSAFGTAIHNFAVNGKMYSANASDPQIPAALAPVVAGVVSLNSFPRQSHARRVGQVRKVKGKAGLEPLFTFPNPFLSGNYFGVAPADFATIYNSAPLISAGNDGTGQTIAIVGETNINVQDVKDFRTMFGLPANFDSPNIVLNGEDPGITSLDEEGEADLDVQWSGAVAPGATIKFVVSASTATTAGIDLSALYIIEHNLAGVMSESYGACESSLGTAGNSFYNQLWEQAAAQGITAILSAGDGGSAGCDDFDTESVATQGTAVSGLASTPYNVSVGGTDFDQVNNWPQYWSPTNNATNGASALGYIPEIPWNQNCAQFGLTGCGSNTAPYLQNIVAGGGGPSTKHSKPSWQMGVTGVPNDSHRDQPDVSLFASAGFNSSGYIYCQRDQNNNEGCDLADGIGNFSLVGGTSASAPAFAGVMVLVNQYEGTHGGNTRQGNANYVLYQLVKQAGASCTSAPIELPACIFNDVTHGNSEFAVSFGTNSVPCQGGARGCSASTNNIGVLEDTSVPPKEAWLVAAGYDMVTGLGSVNVNNLAKNWNTVSTVATATALSLAPTTGITHGTAENVAVNITVKPGTGNGVPSGDVALLAKFADGTTQGLNQFTLTSGAVVGSKTQALPGGTYNVYAHYAGDGTNAPSDSASVQVTVAKESSQTFIVVPTFAWNTGAQLSGNATTLSYGTRVLLRTYITNSAGVASAAGPPTGTCETINYYTCPTGTVTLTDNGQALDQGTYNMNNEGYTRDLSSSLQAGTHQIIVAYSGDNSYAASTTTDTVTITPATTTTEIFGPPGPALVGTNFQLGTLTQALVPGVAPSGTVSFQVDGTTPLTLAQPETFGGQAGVPPNGSANFSVTAIAALNSPGTHTITAKYSGDSNYQASSSSATTFQVQYPTTIALTESSTNVTFGQSITITAKVTGGSKTPPLTGTINILGPFTSISGAPATASVDVNGNQVLTASVSVAPQGGGTISVQYMNDSNYASASTYGDFINVTTPDFSVPAATTINVTAGQTGMGSIQIVPASNVPSTVLLTMNDGILPFGSSLAITPSSAVLNGSAVPVALTLTTIGPSGASQSMAKAQMRRSALFSLAKSDWLSTALFTGILAIYLFGMDGRKRRYRAVFFSAMFCAVTLGLGCGGGGGTTGGGTTGGGVVTVPTTITLTSNNPKVAAGGSFTLTATVSSTKPVAGTVTFYLESGDISGPVPVMNGMASFVLPNSTSIGTYNCTAKYSGDTNNQPSQTATGFNEVITGSTNITIKAQTGSISHFMSVTINLQ
jgi:Pro-kumamolisin, activation domain/Bacterial Ig-like domain (group 3)